MGDDGINDGQSKEKMGMEMYCYGPATNKWRITRQNKFY